MVIVCGCFHVFNIYIYIYIYICVGYPAFTSLIEATLTCFCVPCLALHITKEWFSKLVRDRVEPSDVFLVFTVDQGLNVVNAIEALNVPVVVCNAHRLNTVIC